MATKHNKNVNLTYKHKKWPFIIQVAGRWFRESNMELAHMHAELYTRCLSIYDYSRTSLTALIGYPQEPWKETTSSSSTTAGEDLAETNIIHGRLLRANTKDYGRYDPAPALVRPPFKLIPNWWNPNDLPRRSEHHMPLHIINYRLNKLIITMALSLSILCSMS